MTRFNKSPMDTIRIFLSFSAKNRSKRLCAQVENDVVRRVQWLVAIKVGDFKKKKKKNTSQKCNIVVITNNTQEQTTVLRSNLMLFAGWFFSIVRKVVFRFF